jgi:hypothetical protein
MPEVIPSSQVCSSKITFAWMQTFDNMTAREYQLYIHTRGGQVLNSFPFFNITTSVNHTQLANECTPFFENQIFLNLTKFLHGNSNIHDIKLYILLNYM